MEFAGNKSILKQSLFKEMFLLLALVGGLNYIANLYHLYWSTNEFDSVVHFFGGATLSAGFLWFYFFSGLFSPVKRDLKTFLLVSIFGAMFVALSWEIFELFLGEAIMNKAEYPFDTMLDLIMDFLGILAVCFYGYLKEHNAKS